MFFPTSPSPPSGMIRIPVTGASLTRWLCGNEYAQALEAGSHLLLLFGRRLDQRQAQAADLVAEDVEGSLDRDRVRLHLQQLVGRLQRLVDPPRLDMVALLVEPDHLLHLWPDDVRVDADATDAAQLE